MKEVHQNPQVVQSLKIRQMSHLIKPSLKIFVAERLVDELKETPLPRRRISNSAREIAVRAEFKRLTRTELLSLCELIA